MKMKEVTEQTGLTERTVRYYMEKGLIAPHGQWRNGREYTEFDETDIARLKAVATLRELGFSVEAIRSMQAEPGLIPQIVAERRQAAESESKIAAHTKRHKRRRCGQHRGTGKPLPRICRAAQNDTEPAAAAQNGRGQRIGHGAALPLCADRYTG